MWDCQHGYIRSNTGVLTGVREFCSICGVCATFFTVNDIPDGKKTAVFLSVVGSSMYGLLHNLVAPASPKDKSFDEIFGMLKAHFEPKLIVIVQRYRFHRREQALGKSVTADVAELCCLASTCAFGEYLDQALRDRLVCSLRSESIQRSLLSVADLDLARAVKVAQGMEAAHKNTQTLKSPELQVGKLEKIQQPRRILETSKPDGHAGSKPCYHCGRMGHLPRACGFKEVVCHKCHKRGHLAKVCKSSKAPAHCLRQRMKWVGTKPLDHEEVGEEQFIC